MTDLRTQPQSHPHGAYLASGWAIVGDRPASPDELVRAIDHAGWFLVALIDDGDALVALDDDTQNDLDNDGGLDFESSDAIRLTIEMPGGGM